VQRSEITSYHASTQVRDEGPAVGPGWAAGRAERKAQSKRRVKRETDDVGPKPGRPGNKQEQRRGRFLSSNPTLPHRDFVFFFFVLLWPRQWQLHS
jgi:hypothetical protein